MRKISAKNIELYGVVGARQSFQVLSQITWFLGYIRAFSKLSGILHYFAKWRIPKLTLKASTMSFNALSFNLKPVWDFTLGWNLTLVWGNFIVSVHMTSGVVKLTSVQISLRSNWPKWNFKLQRVFHVNSICPKRIKLRRIIKVAN